MNLESDEGRWCPPAHKNLGVCVEYAYKPVLVDFESSGFDSYALFFNNYFLDEMNGYKVCIFCASKIPNPATACSNCAKNQL